MTAADRIGIARGRPSGATRLPIGTDSLSIPPEILPLRCAQRQDKLASHHTLHAFAPRTIGLPSWQLNAFANSGMLATTPLTRYLSGECGLVTALTRRFSGRLFSQAHWAMPMKNRWSGVKPSTDCSDWLAVAS